MCCWTCRWAVIRKHMVPQRLWAVCLKTIWCVMSYIIRMIGVSYYRLQSMPKTPSWMTIYVYLRSRWTYNITWKAIETKNLELRYPSKAFEHSRKSWKALLKTLNTHIKYRKPDRVLNLQIASTLQIKKYFWSSEFTKRCWKVHFLSLKKKRSLLQEVLARSFSRSKLARILSD